MKINLKIEAGSEKLGARSPVAGIQTSSYKLLTSSRRSGIALVITLILLAVTLVMALAFLTISRHESSSVTTAGETTTARLAADSALANAEGQVMANILATKNPYNFGLLVSTNAPPLNFNNGLADYTTLQISPRPPVFIPQNGTNDFRFYLDLNRNGSFDANGYVVEVDNNNNIIDTNYNAVGDPEWIGVLEHPDQPYGPNNPFIARYAFIALPVGNALDLNYIYNQALDENNAVTTVNPLPAGDGDGYFRNQGVGSWEINLPAFLADLNTNEWDNTTAGTYQYNPPPGVGGSQGVAFDDARALLAYRYANNYSSLATVQNLFGNAGATAFQNDNIDGYSDGPLQTTVASPGDVTLPSLNDNPALPWAGADNTNHFFTPSDFFDTTKTETGVTPPGFTEHLLNAGTNYFGGTTSSTYDRYTFYRLLSELGTDTTPETGKMNLNYDNLDPYVYTVGGISYTNAPSATNFLAWTPLGFFTNAADRMLRDYSTEWLMADSNNFVATFSVTNAFGITDIPVWVSNRFVYTPAVNRILQLAANIYDATTTNFYPDVFRPLFTKDAAGDVFIAGYTNLNSIYGPNTVSGTNDLQLSQPFDVETISALTGTTVPADINIYGVPWIIGAKKGLPNFNEISMENNLVVARRLQVTRPTINSATSVNIAAFATNQLYMMSLNSSIGVELWNSYAANYPGTVMIDVNENASTMITNNDQGLWALQPATNNASFTFNPTINPWRGSSPWYGGNPNPASFVPITFTGPTLTNSIYRSSFYRSPIYPNGPYLFPTNSIIGQIQYELASDGNGFNFPQFGVLLTNRLQVFMLDFSGGVYHVIDYVHFEGPDSWFNVNSNLADPDIGVDQLGVWNTNYPPGSPGLPVDPTHGIINQINISKTGANPQIEDGQWQSDPQAVPLGGTKAQQAVYFQAFFLPGNHIGNVTNLQTSIQAPYSPTRYITQYITWQVNDPLVHYLASDIDEPVAGSSPALEPGLHTYNYANTNGLTSLNLGQLNDRYMPWGGNPELEAPGRAAQPDPNAYNSAERDPLAYSSDNWDFPTNKFPTTGLLGRVHRGTPWQTVYLKSSPIDTGTWATWTGDTLLTGNQNFDAANSTPTNDRALFDLFTTAFNDNATRGQLPINQPGLAAWSALLSGVVALTNYPVLGGTVTNMNIQPAGVYNPTNLPALVQIVQGINNERATLVNADGLKGSFEHIGDILGTPQLTEQSPFISIIPQGMDNAGQIIPPVYPSDEVMEWLPQQMMSLLRTGTPRYVIYSYGQTLEPAAGATYLGAGNYFGMVTNYQIVAETATRSVVRFDSSVTNLNNTLTVTNNRAVIERYNILPPD